MKIEEFRQYLRIDKLELDREVVEQPALFFEVAEAYSAAAADRDCLKERLASVDATLDTEARAKADAKVTEAQVKAYIAVSPQHINAFDQWLVAKEKADQLQALKEAFQQRSYMLRDLVSLHNSSYFEESSLRASASHDQLVYEQNKAKLAAARARDADRDR